VLYGSRMADGEKEVLYKLKDGKVQPYKSRGAHLLST
jgi:hypothetical protein